MSERAKESPDWDDAHTELRKSHLIAIADALGLQVKKGETATEIVQRCIDTAQDLRRDLRLAMERSRR